MVGCGWSGGGVYFWDDVVVVGGVRVDERWGVMGGGMGFWVLGVGVVG